MGEYARIIQEQTGATKSCKLSIAEDDFLPASCLGGVKLSCFGGKISIDNTIDLRLQLVMEQAKPAIRVCSFLPSEVLHIGGGDRQPAAITDACHGKRHHFCLLLSSRCHCH